MNNKIKLSNLFLKLRPLKVFGILLIFDIKIFTNNLSILANKMSFRKLLILILFSYLLVNHGQSNVSVNL